MHLEHPRQSLLICDELIKICSQMKNSLSVSGPGRREERVAAKGHDVWNKMYFCGGKFALAKHEKSIFHFNI